MASPEANAKVPDGWVDLWVDGYAPFKKVVIVRRTLTA